MSVIKITGILGSETAAKAIGITRQGLAKAAKEQRIDVYKIGKLSFYKVEDVNRFKSRRIRF